MKNLIKRVSRAMSAAAVAIALAACGGGTSQSAQDTAVTQRTLVVNAVIATVDGQATNRFTEGEDFDVRVVATERAVQTSSGRVLSDTSTPAANVTVSLEATGATVSPVSGTALTDSEGRAQFRLKAGDLAGAFGALIAAEKSGLERVQKSLPFAIDRTLLPRLSLLLFDASGNPVANARPGDEVRVQLLAQKVRATAIGVAEQFEPAADVRIDLAAESGRFEPSGSQVVTDAEGRSSAVFVPGLFNGPVRVTAAAMIDGKIATSVAVIDVRVPQIRVGHGTPFVAGLRIDPPEIESGATARISAQLIGEDGSVFEEPLPVRFESACVSQGASEVLSPVLSAGGSLATVYRAAGCVGQDRLRALVDVPGLEQPAVGEGVIRIREPRAEGIAFVSVDAPDIALRGRATPERPDTARVTFAVRNSAGVPVPAAGVSFALTGRVGDTTLQSPRGVTDTNGEVVAVVRAGDAAAVVAVQARVEGTSFAATSRQIVAATGGADQDSFSLSVSTFNIEGFDIDGATTTVTARAADRFNNPVADGTSILFTTEGGAVPARCETAGGVCSVDLVSQQPRPANGRVTLLARTEGSESFFDANGNGLFDGGEPFDDLAEAFVDANENGVWDGTEVFIDTNGNGRYDGPNGRFDGGPCASPASCGLSTDVRGATVLVFSTSIANIQIVPNAIAVDDVTPRDVQILISDLNGNLPAAGSRVEVTTSNGRLLTDVNGEIGNSNSRGPYVIRTSLIGDGEASSGVLSVRVTSPSGAVSNATARVSDSSVCDSPSGFSPPPVQCEGGAQVGSVVASPETIAVPAGGSVEQNIAIRVMSGGGTSVGVPGVTPAVMCETRSGIAGEVLGGIQSTSATGDTTARLRVTAGPGASGEAACQVSAGGVTATVRLVGPPAGGGQAGSISVAPGSVRVQPNQSNREVLLLATVANAASPPSPLPGATPSVRCSLANAVGMVLSPGVAAPTDASGRTEVPIFYSTDAAPSGSAVCEVSVGTALAVVTFAP